MKAVVDTNVVAYYLLGTDPFAKECGHFWRRIETAFAPAVWEAELANVIWMAARHGVVTAEQGAEKLRFARRLRIRSISNASLWQGALVRSLASGIAVYDTLFVELAARRDLPLVTYDKPLIKAFSTIASRPEAVARRARTKRR